MGTRSWVLVILFLVCGLATGVTVHFASSVMSYDEQLQNRNEFREYVKDSVAKRQVGRAFEQRLDGLISMVRKKYARVWGIWRPSYPEIRPYFSPKEEAGKNPLGSIPKLAEVLSHVSGDSLMCNIGPLGPSKIRLCVMSVKVQGDGGEWRRFDVMVAQSDFRGDRVTHMRRLVPFALLAWMLVVVVGYLAFFFVVVRPLRRVNHAMNRAATTRIRFFFQGRGPVEYREIAESFNEIVRTQEQIHDRFQFRLEQLERIHEELSDARDTLVRSEQLAQAGVMAAGIAHEVGNPLGIVSGYLDLLNAPDVTPEEQSQYITRVQNGLGRINQTLRNLLDFSRHEGELSPPNADISAVLVQILELIRPQLRFENIHITTEIEETLPRVNIAAGHLEQVLLNLIINAGDAIGGDGNVTLKAEQDGEMVRLLVMDDGPGISTDVGDRIFDPFVTTKAPGKGTGLGLFVCRNLITSYGGEIRLVHQVNGACFEIMLWAWDGSPVQTDLP
ncbi:MAG: hypothetical protein CMH54_05360 [Myxococcales bacterium]|nr:hypothetical protein [Myxococcales bacterium]